MAQWLLGSAMLVVDLYGLEGLFQPKLLYDSVLACAFQVFVLISPGISRPCQPVICRYDLVWWLERGSTWNLCDWLGLHYQICHWLAKNPSKGEWVIGSNGSAAYVRNNLFKSPSTGKSKETAGLMFMPGYGQMWVICFQELWFLHISHIIRNNHAISFL